MSKTDVPGGKAPGDAQRTRGPLRRTLLLVLLLGLGTAALWGLIRGTGALSSFRRYLPAAAPRPFTNVVLIGWDGCFIDDVLRLMDEGRLPNLKRLRDEGSMVDTFVTAAKTETKPGWAEILTGYGPDVTGVYDNRERYGTIPEGLTIFERLRARYGQDGIRLIFLAGKLQNLGFRGPHRIRVGGERKSWHDEELWTEGEAAAGDILEHDAEPFHIAQKSFDIGKNGLGDAEFVGREALAGLDRFGRDRFFMFLHFWEPDESGHDYGEGSKPYVDSIAVNDEWLGRILQRLRDLGIYDQTLVYVVTDHGFDRGRVSHIFAAHTWLITNDNVRFAEKGDRMDITPTLLDRYGFDVQGLQPPLKGHSLLR